MKATLLCSLLGLALLTGCNENPNAPAAKDTAPEPQTQAAAESKTEKPAASASEAPADDADLVAIIKTTEGDMVIEFWPDVAPKTVASFKRLARENAYNGTIFHRIMKGFMIQGGDLISKDPSKEALYGTGDPGFTLPAEFSDRKHVRGVISMARKGHDVNSASSQFFIVLGDATFLDGQYTAFGKLIKGDDVLEKIGNTPVTFQNGERSKPTKRVEITAVELVPRDQITQ